MEGIMKTLDKGQEKINKICSILREESLEPAKKQAEEILSDARKQAEHIIDQAHLEAKALVSDAKHAVEQERNVFNSSLQQASKQSLEALRQEIEKMFFNDQLNSMIEKDGTHPDIIAKLVNALVKALEKEGLSADLSAIVPDMISANEINQLLLKEVLNSLNGKSVELGKFAAGAQVRINNKKITIDMSEQALKDLLSKYVVRKDFRKMIFSAS